MSERQLKDIEQRLGELTRVCKDPVLYDAMSYSLRAAGKRFRPMLTLSACESVKGSYGKSALDFACALEMIHTYSLVHDDLPCMDDDELRRGQPSSHVKYGESTALLAGDALLSLAFEIMSKVSSKKKKKRYIVSMHEIAKAVGVNGMITGQLLDMRHENDQGSEALELIHMKKTSAFIEACLAEGARLGGCERNTIDKMRRLGRSVGLSYQIMDDILDVQSENGRLGKPLGSDAKNNKCTFVTVYGIERARVEYGRLANESLDILAAIPQKNSSLSELIMEIIDRKY